MSTHRCPGQDIRFWKVKDIFEVQCPYCQGTIEFWKDDPFRSCPGCGERVSNPRIDLSCAKWCKYAEECLGTLPDGMVPATPVIERLIAVLTKHLAERPLRMKWAREVCSLAETLMTVEGGEPQIIKSAALIAGTFMRERGELSLSDVQTQKPLLEEAGLETGVVEKICAIIETVTSNTSHESLESEIVGDALQLERLSLVAELKNDVESLSVITKNLKTESGKRMARRYT